MYVQCTSLILILYISTKSELVHGTTYSKLVTKAGREKALHRTQQFDDLLMHRNQNVLSNDVINEWNHKVAAIVDHMSVLERSMYI